MKTKAIVVDIDNTLLTQNKRKRIIIKELFDVDITLEEIEQDFSLNCVLAKIAKEKNTNLQDIRNLFSEKFFGEEYNQPEYFECLEQAPHYLNLIAKKHKIIYLSARDYRTRDLTVKQLEYFGFPKMEGVNELIVMPKELCPDKWTGKDLEDFHDISLKFKKDILNKLKFKNNVIVGIGDTISDLEACYNNDILSVIIQSSIVVGEGFVKEHSIDPYSYIVLDTWEEIYNYVSAVSLENQELKEICIQHSNDYSKWMYDLDNKASLILVAASFCITSFISLLNSRSYEILSIKILILAGTVSELLPVK